MIAGQLGREFAVRSLRWWLPIAALLGLWLTAMTRSSDALPGPVPLEGWPDGVVAVISFTWTVMAIYFLNAGFASRSSGRLDLALPLPTRGMWLTHMLAIVGCGFCIPLVLGAFLALGNALTRRDPLLDPGLLSLGIHACVVMLLALAVLQSPKPELQTIPARGGYVALGAFTGLGSIALLFWLCAMPRVWVLVPLVLAGALALRVYLSLPTSFTLVSRDAEPATESASTRQRTETMTRARRTLLTASVVWRNSFGNWTLLYLLVFVGYGPLLAMMIQFEGWHDQALPLIFWTWLLFCCWILVTFSKLYTLDPLPLDRRRIFAALIAPPLIIVSLFYAVVVVGLALFGASAPSVEVRGVCNHRCVVVPNDYWKIAWDGRLPTHVSPQGETVSPCCKRTFLPGLSAVVYKPYHTPRDASPDLVAWQISRAVEAVHGLSIPPEQIRERYLTRDEEGRVALTGEIPGLKRVRHGTVFPVVLMMIGLPALAFAAAGCRIGRATTPMGARRYLPAGLFVVAMVLGMGGLAAASAGLLDLDTLARWVGTLVREAGQAIPGGGLVIWLLAALSLAAAYIVARTQFVRMELPTGGATRK